MDYLAHRPTFGQNIAIGMLYDARKDEFLSDNLLKSTLPDEAFQFIAQNTADVTTTYGDTYRKRFESLNVSSAIACSMLTDSIRCRGSSRYVTEPLDSQSTHAALQHTLHTCDQTLNFQFGGLRDHLTSDTTPNPNATHMVSGIKWGSKTIISARVYTKSNSEQAAVSDQLQILFATFASILDALGNATAGNGANGSMPHTDTTWPAEISAYSDMFEEDDGILLSDLGEALEFLEMAPLHAKSTLSGKGWPIACTLLPLEMISAFLGLRAQPVPQVCYPALDFLDSSLGLFDDYMTCERHLSQHQWKLSSYAQYLPPEAQDDISRRVQKLQIAIRNFKGDFTRTFASAKAGEADPGSLREILDRYQKGDLSPHQIGNFSISNVEALAFIETAVSSGALYVGHNGLRLEETLLNHGHKDAFVFYFTPAVMEHEETWKPNLELLSEVLQTRGSDAAVIVVDCDATSILLDKARIAQYQDGQAIVEDLLGHRSFMADKCFAECDEQTLETEDIQPPILRRHVMIPCPGAECSVTTVREWLCPRCLSPVEYGYSDQFIYCNCGRSLYSNYAFKCSSELHGTHFTSYDSHQLKRSLDGLAQTNYLNILILGETGVGKSTFINAMVNYLEFETLDEAIEADKLNWVIPCSFATQIMDRTKPNRPIEEKRIKIGARDDEHDGSKGDSATQKTTVYPVTFRSGDSTLTVRLIDTPGIGDSRGVDADRQNMADILSTLSGYDSVHGILILLKSNNARLTITFRYCIKELLTHLHHNAAANMAFGFTNTRISNYTPGDTYGPLKALLLQHPDVGLHLETPTTYCFDSESFRYLAAYKSGVVMENKLDFDRSWSQSRDETVRLIEHFQSIPPHEVKSTLSLNGARQLISELTKPLAEITQLINRNIQVQEDQVEALKDARIKGDELRDLLDVQKVQMNSEPLPMPRTVCGDKTCVEVRDDGKGQNEKVIVHKQHCHPVCHLHGVQADVLSHPGLINCAAFSGGNDCQKCGHHWSQHLHILYELHEETVIMTDDAIKQQLVNHADDLTLKIAAVKQKQILVEEYRQEQEIIRDTAAKFCVFLKKNSLVPYNDALIAYLDFLIKEEQAKVQAGGNDKRLLSLTEERHKHQEAIQVITRNMNSSAGRNDLSESSVDRMVQSLYNLKHFGENLKKLKQGIATAHQATYRERPYTVTRRNQPRNMPRTLRTQPLNQPKTYQGNARGSSFQQSRLSAQSTSGGMGLLSTFKGLFT